MAADNKLIAKNTFLLYVRMLVALFISLFTSRIILYTLGVEDYGISNIVGGFIIMFGFLNSSMASATQRFLSFEIGKGDYEEVRNVFSMSLNAHFLIALIIIILGETLGLWFVNTQLNIPSERMIAAKWVYQFSLFTFCINVISAPYNGIIIANEKMNIYPWVGIFEMLFKLLGVFMLQSIYYDKLKLYAVLVFLTSIIIRIIYGIYCRRYFPETKYKIVWINSLFKKMISYAGWNLWGDTAGILCNQGVNVILNIFFGPSINAARGIAYSARNAIINFVKNFQMAMNPQIIKTYAVSDLKSMHQLIFQGSKFSYYLILILSLPILLETEIILKIWLSIVPEHTVLFIKLIIIVILIDTISGPLMTAAQASGNIKLYQGIVGGILLLIVPLSYLFLKLGYPPEVTLFINIVISIFSFFIRLIILKKLVQLNNNEFFLQVVWKIVFVTLITIPLPLSVHIFYKEQSLLKLFVVGFTSSISSIVTVYILGLNRNERDFLNIFVKKRISLLFNQVKRCAY